LESSWENGIPRLLVWMIFCFAQVNLFVIIVRDVFIFCFPTTFVSVRYRPEDAYVFKETVWLESCLELTEGINTILRLSFFRFVLNAEFHTLD
jgi:hypothetical protein